jgi:cytochrome c oxidase subunit 3
MVSSGLSPAEVAVTARRTPVVPNAVLGTLLFVIAEAMLFAGLIAAFTIVKSGALGTWPPIGQPRLPVESTAFNSAVLFLSGGVLFQARRAFRVSPERAAVPLLVASLLGAFFVVFQGYEWVAMLRQGLTMASSIHGGFFYLIVGVHALHAIGALVMLFRAWIAIKRGAPQPDLFAAAQVFWVFVIGVWPVIYLTVYL